MELLPSAHVDTFCRDHLPPFDQWPELTFELPELHYPDRLNCATALLDDIIAEHGADRPCLHAPGADTWSYADLLAAANRWWGGVLALLLDGWSLRFLPLRLSALLVAGGMIVGGAGGFAASRHAV